MARFENGGGQNELRNAHERIGFEQHDAAVLAQLAGQHLPEGPEETAQDNKCDGQQGGALFRQANDNGNAHKGNHRSQDFAQVQFFAGNEPAEKDRHGNLRLQHQIRGCRLDAAQAPEDEGALNGDGEGGNQQQRAPRGFYSVAHGDEHDHGNGGIDQQHHEKRREMGDGGLGHGEPGSPAKGGNKGEQKGFWVHSTAMELFSCFRKFVLVMFRVLRYISAMPTLIDNRPSVSFDPAITGAGKLTALPQQMRGRGARNNEKGRYEKNKVSFFDDGWETLAELPPLKTTIFEEQPKTIIARNQSPDISFDRSINPYRGCEHGCVYCYARPTHAYMGLSPGLDFESKLFIKPNAAALLREELTAPNYTPAHHCAGLQYGSLPAD